MSAELDHARPLAASLPQRMAYGERAGQQVRRIGSGCGYKGESPTLTGTRCASGNGFALHAAPHVPAHRRGQGERLSRSTARGALALERLQDDANGARVYTVTKPGSDGSPGITLSPVAWLEKLAALVPLPRVHLVHYGGCLAPHSRRREAVIPTRRQQGVEGHAASTEATPWRWARLLQRVFTIDLATWPWCQWGSLRIIVAITQVEVIKKILRHLQLAADPPPIASARLRQEAFEWVA